MQKIQEGKSFENRQIDEDKLVILKLIEDIPSCRYADVMYEDRNFRLGYEGFKKDFFQPRRWIS